VDPTLDDQNEPPRNPPLPKAVKGGAYLGLTVGWLGGLIYVLVVFPSIGFEQQSSADGILIAAPIIGAGVGTSIGYLLRSSDRFARLTAPNWIAVKEVRWGWRTGGVVGILLARHYISANSPLGFYTGSIALVFETIAPFFAALGGAIGFALATNRDGAVPPTAL
jgi:hypothetical protein